jgi:transcription antitermination factor NusG
MKWGKIGTGCELLFGKSLGHRKGSEKACRGLEKRGSVTHMAEPYLHSKADDPGGGATERLNWYALHTRYQHEKVIAQSLTNKGLRVFLPLYTAAHRWKDRVKPLTLPLFPCYVFIRGGLERQLHILTTPGIRRFVGNEGRPWVIPDEEIEAVRQAVERGARVEPHPFLKCGDWVRVKSGPLEGIEGILVRKKNQFRLVLSVELLQKSAAVEVEVWAVERIARQVTMSVSCQSEARIHAWS